MSRLPAVEQQDQSERCPEVDLGARWRLALHMEAGWGWGGGLGQVVGAALWAPEAGSGSSVCFGDPASGTATAPTLLPVLSEEALCRTSQAMSLGSALHWVTTEADTPDGWAWVLPHRKGHKPDKGEPRAASEPQGQLGKVVVTSLLPKTSARTLQRPGAPTPGCNGAKPGLHTPQSQREPGISGSAAHSELAVWELFRCSCSCPSATTNPGISVLQGAQEGPPVPAGLEVSAPAAWPLLAPGAHSGAQQSCG